MKTASVSQLKKELLTRSSDELLELVLRLSKFKKENKELLTYLLYEIGNEAGYIQSVQEEIDDQFDQINTKTTYYIKKSVRKILRLITKYSRYTKEKRTEIELLIYFCQQMNVFRPSMHNSLVLHNIYLKQVEKIQKLVGALHEDFQLDYEGEIESLM